MAGSESESNLAKRAALRIALVYALVAALWIVVSDKLAGLFFTTAASLQTAQAYKGGLFVAVTALLLYILIRNLFSGSAAGSFVSPQVDARAPDAGGLHGWVPFLAFVLLALAIGAIGYYTFDHYRREIRAERQKTLGAIADLKVTQISDWLAERRERGEILSRSTLFAGMAEHWLRGGGRDAVARDKLLERMRAERDVYGYSKVAFFDTAGKEWLDVGDKGETIAAHERIFVGQAVHGREIFFSDFHRGGPETGSKIELDMLVPLLVHDGGEKRVVGALYFRIDPHRQLYPLIQSMPIPSDTGESLLVRGEGGDVVFLNELRHRRDTALNLRLPLSTKGLPAAMAVRGQVGMVRGVDYRGVPVLASVQRIAGMPWGLVVKIDEAEIFAPIRWLATFVIISTLVFVALAGAMVALWWRQQRAAFAARQYQSERARQKSETDYRVLFDSMLNGFALCEIIVDDAGIPCDFRYLEINPAFERLTGLKRETVVGKRVREVIPGIEPVWIETYGKVALNGEEARFQDYVAELGIYFDVMAFGPEKGRFAVIFDNVTERTLAQQKIARLTRFYDTLSHTNEAIVRIAGREELLAAVCRIAVVHGQFKAAALRRVDAATGKATLSAYFGLEDDELKEGEFSSNPSNPLGQLPTAVALREGKPYICNDAFGDSATQPRLNLLQRLEIGALAVFPVFSESEIYGALSLYAGEPGFFDENMVALLQEMATDISFALGNFAREESRMQTVEALRESEARFRTIFDSINDAIFVYDVDTGTIADVNRRMCEMYGYSREEALQLEIQDISSGEPPYTQQDALQWISKAMQGEPQTFEWRAKTRDGRLFWAEVNLQRASIGGMERLLASVRDIGERKLAEEKLHLDALVFESSSEGMLITDASNCFVGVNRAFTEITGYTLDEVRGRNPRMLKSDRQDDAFYRDMWGIIQTSGHWQGELWNRRKNGEVYPEWLNITVVRDAAGKVTHHIGTMTDVSDRKLAEDEIYHLSRYDALTGLPNKFLLEYRLTQALGRADESRQHVGVAMVNLDSFHTVNDSAGYAVGDQVLVKVAQRLSAAVREEDIVARFGADNFVVVEPYPGNINEFIGKVEKLLVAIAQPIEIEGREIQLNASLGVSLYPGDGSTAMDLIQKSGIAMRHAKTEGGNNYSFFAEEMNSRALAEMALSNDLRHAEERGELQLHYQTQVDSFSGEIVGVEALLRWQHPKLGLLMPKDFIALAEENGLIVPIGDWVLREACRQMNAWHVAGHAWLFVSVNVSALQFKQANLAQTAMKAIRESGLDAGFVELEMTESMIMSHFEQTLATLTELKAFGVHFSIDDFGTGYSSLNYLKHFPIDKLKIDISFITDIATDPDNAAIVKAMIAMGHSLQMKMIAEGVETEAQAGYLRTIHCDEMQGYYFSRPLPAEQVSALLHAPQPLRTGAEGEGERVLLLVDDEANVISALKRVLRRDGYRILTAGSAQEGLDLLAKHPVGVILSDQRMPNMTGIEFLSKVKVMYPEVVRMVLSGYTEVNTMTEAINRGAIYKFLTKPWEDEPLRETIKEAFLRYETERDEG